MELSEELRLGLTYFAGEAVDCSDLMEEAADRIAAQAAEIERLRDKIDHIGVKHPQDLLITFARRVALENWEEEKKHD